MAEDLYKLSWQQFRENITANFRELRGTTEFHDVSLYIDHQHSVGAHKVILCTVSPYFRRLLSSLPPAAAAHPVLLMPKDITQAEVGQILDYVYFGEVSLPQGQVQRFLDIAEHFEIRGLREDPQLSSDANRQSSPQNASISTLAAAGKGSKSRHPSNTMRSVGLVCPQCDLICKDVAELKTHIAETHSRPRSRFPCTICDQSFKTSAAMDAHMNSHYTTADHRPVGSVAPQLQQQTHSRGARQVKTPSSHQLQQQPLKTSLGQQQQARRPPPPLSQPVKVENKGRLSGNKYEADYQSEEPQAKKSKTGDIASTLSERFGGGISVSSVASGLPPAAATVKVEEVEGEIEQYHQEEEEVEEEAHHLNEDAGEDDAYEGYYGEEGDEYEEEEYPSYDNYGHA